MAISGGYTVVIYTNNITATTVSFYASNDEAASPTAYKIYASDGTTVVQSGTSGSDGVAHITGLTPETTYIVEANDVAGTRETFTTLEDAPKVATESMWAELIDKVKSAMGGSTVLFSGHQSGTVTLSDSAANYQRIKIFFSNNDGMNNSVEIYDPDGKRVNLANSFDTFDGAT